MRSVLFVLVHHLPHFGRIVGGVGIPGRAALRYSPQVMAPRVAGSNPGAWVMRQNAAASP